MGPTGNLQMLKRRIPLLAKYQTPTLQLVASNHTVKYVPTNNGILICDTEICVIGW